VLAAIAAVAEAVPMAGSIAAGLIAVGLAFTSSAQLALMVAVFFFVMHEFEANI
jgi:predicted PurR-regulated permease PerM